MEENNIKLRRRVELTLELLMKAQKDFTRQEGERIGRPFGHRE